MGVEVGVGVGVPVVTCGVEVVGISVEEVVEVVEVVGVGRGVLVVTCGVEVVGGRSRGRRYCRCSGRHKSNIGHRRPGPGNARAAKVML